MGKISDRGSWKWLKGQIPEKQPWPSSRYVTITLFWKYILKSLIENVFMYKFNRRVGEE